MFDNEITKVQIWNNNGSFMGLIPKSEAEEMVKTGKWNITNGVGIYPK